MMHFSICVGLLLALAANAGAQRVFTGQTVRPAGDVIAFAGRPVDLVLAPDGRTAFVKNISGLTVLDVATWQVQQDLPFKPSTGSSMHGIAITRDGTRLFLTTAGSELAEARVNADGSVAWTRVIALAGSGKGSYPCGLALSADGQRAYVALSRNNSVAIVDLAAGKLETEIPAGVAPFDVALAPDGVTAYVSNWGGRRPGEGDRTMKSSGTDTLVDTRDIPNSGTVAKLDLTARKVGAELRVGLHPSGLAVRRDGTRLYVANANSDTISVIDPQAWRVIETILVRPNAALPFGSITCGLALSADERTLFAANGGNNAVAVIGLGGTSTVRGFIPAGWFPSAVATDGKQLFIANTKGDGTPWPHPDKPGRHVKWHRGTASKVALPGWWSLRQLTAQVRADALVPQALQAFEKSQRGQPPVPVPAHAGELSVFDHVVYVLKENRTYDQLLGDIGRGNSDSNLCIYGREVTPNHHALAEQFVLLDNYFCNGVVSADGHQWATQGITTDYQEKTFGGWTRSYDFGSDPLAFAPTAFIWDDALVHGLSFRNYGEFDWPKLVPASAKWADVFTGKATFTHLMSIEPLKRYTAPDYPGWNLRIPDVVRLEKFLAEFRQYEKNGWWPNLVFVYLPQDHTSGHSKAAPTPRAHVADNDLALGRLIEAISHSQFWPKTCIFVNEDDPQDGFDHVDGHRSLCLVVSPYTKRNTVVSTFYNQTAVLHTIERILGLPPMNQLDALAPTMEDCFNATADLTPFTALKNSIPLDEMPEGKTASVEFDLSRPDRIDDDVFNRLLWHAAKGAAAPYPVAFAGAHGRGLKPLGLRLDSARGRKDDD